MEQHQPGPQLIGFPRRHAIRRLLGLQRIDLLKGVVIAVDQTGVLIDEHGVQQEFGGNVPQEADAGGLVVLKQVAKQEREIGADFQESLRGVKPVIVVEMLFNATGDLGLNLIFFFDKGSYIFHAQADASINHGEEIGQGGPCQKIRAIDKSHSMSKVIHKTLRFSNCL